jgi:hypothetical protein
MERATGAVVLMADYDTIKDRFILVSPDEATIHVVSRKLFHEVMGGVAALPQWAGQRFKSAKVLIAYKGNVPLLVAIAEGRIEQLSETGVIDADFGNLKLTSKLKTAFRDKADPQTASHTFAQRVVDATSWECHEEENADIYWRLTGYFIEGKGGQSVVAKIDARSCGPSRT